MTALHLQLPNTDPHMTMSYEQARNSLDRVAVLPAASASAQDGMLNID